MHLSLGSSSNKEAQQQESKEARRLFRESIRTDWDYPPLEAVEDEGSAIEAVYTIGGFRIHQSITRELAEQVVPNIVDWRERYYGSSDSDIEDDFRGASARMNAHSKKAEYLFEGPDSVGQELSDRALARKRKHQLALAEEMQWNGGLRHFINRRDAWTNARARSQVQLITSKTAVSVAAEAYNSSMTSSPRSSTSGHTDVTMQSRPSTATTSPDPAAMAKATLSTEDMLIPVMSRLLISHPVRKKIGPSMYSEIYSKIVLQSRTPAVPINLLNLIKALVQGWKADGEWPPKINMPEPSIGRKKASSIKQAVTRVLKISNTESSGKDKKPG